MAKSKRAQIKMICPASSTPPTSQGSGNDGDLDTATFGPETAIKLAKCFLPTDRETRWYVA